MTPASSNHSPPGLGVGARPEEPELGVGGRGRGGEAVLHVPQLVPQRGEQVCIVKSVSKGVKDISW